MEIRSFLAFELPPEIMKTVRRVSQEFRGSPLDARWVRTENVHLTVIFLGNIRKDHLPAMGEAVQKVCSAYGPFWVSLKGMGCFPNTRNPRVLWLGLEGDLERLALFRDELQEPLVSFGVKKEKRVFRPHMTLGRFRGPNRRGSLCDEWVSGYGDLGGPLCVLKELSLFRSTLKPGGAVYGKMSSWPLEGQK